MKRLTDTVKWKNPWFRNLPSKFKLLFLYLLDNCDNAGVIHVDLEVFGFFLKEQFCLDEFKAQFSEKITFISDDKIIINNFIKFQNGDILSSSHPMSKHIAKELERHGLLHRFKKGEFGKGMPWVS